jgi:transcriptional regulator with PAS, ATPase and Fis domain
MRFSQIDMGAGEERLAAGLRSILEMAEIRLLLNRLPDGVVLIGRDGTILALNVAAASINAVAAAEMVGRPMADLTQRSAVDWTEIADSFFARRKGEFVGQTEDGRGILSSIRQFRNDEGEIELAMVVQRDLQVLDHARRSATGGDRRDVFKFLGDRDLGPDFVTQRRLSRSLDRLVQQGEKALRANRRLLLVGEPGSGKTEIARYLHRLVDRQAAPFVTVNCGALSEAQFEAEMFGHEKGAAIGGLRGRKPGLVEAAEGGTLFLEGIDEMPEANQVRLLSYLDDGRPGRQGRGALGFPIVKTRIIASAHRDLRALCDAGEFRPDLFYRLAVVTLLIEPLRRQPALIEHLVDHFLASINQWRERKLGLSAACRTKLLAYHFPGNIRELYNIMQHLTVTAAQEATPGDLPPLQARDSPSAALPARRPALGMGRKLGDTVPLKDSVRAFERELIADAIARHGSKRKAARALGVDIGTIVRKTQGDRMD